MREALEGSIGTRVCRPELWNVSQMTGWQVSLSYLDHHSAARHDEARQEALARWASLPGYIDNEIANLRQGIRERYLAPKGSVQIVIEQMDSLIAGTRHRPAVSLAPRRATRRRPFSKTYDEIFKTQILPAFKRYRDFLQSEYLPAARTDIAVAANPNGAACYQAALRAFSTLPIAPKDVHEIGLKQMDALDAGDEGHRRTVVSDLRRAQAARSAQERSESSCSGAARS